MKKLTHIFFDLDHTLWDYDTNSTEALTELYHRFGLDQMFTSATAFIKVFHHVNHQMWDKYNKSEIDRAYIREHRFAQVLEGRMAPDRIYTNEMSDFFISYCPTKSTLMDGALEVLENLHQKYTLGIITNGFDDTQSTKLRSSKIDHFFEYVITSESTGSRKPDPGIFQHALELSTTESTEVLMIGDNIKTDIEGAQAAGWEAIWYKPYADTADDPSFHPRIKHLTEILDLVSS